MHTKEPWEVDHKETDSGSGRYDYYFIMNSDGEVVCDSSNSDVQEIRTEDDENGSYSWDEQGKKDLTRLVQCRNAFAGVTDPAAFMAAVDALINFAESGGGNLPHEVWHHIGNVRSARGKH